MTRTAVEYIAAGGNRHPSAADWAPSLLAYGAGNNIALWNPEDVQHGGVSALLAGHTDLVNAIKIVDVPDQRLIVSGSADRTVRIWSANTTSSGEFHEVRCLTEHTASINAIAAAPQLGLLATGAADGTVKIYHIEGATVKLIQSISLKPRYFPLCLALTAFETGGAVLAVAGTASHVQLYFQTDGAHGEFELHATLTGHEGWIRSLDFTYEHSTPGSDILLASASQDKYARLWRFRRGNNTGSVTVNEASELVPAAEKTSLSNKAHTVGNGASQHTVTFEALLIGHEDWIYTARWAPKARDDAVPSLLTSSADNSLSIWNVEAASGLWVCSSRLGEVSSQKGSTTATGSTGGFWIGLWQHDSHSVVSLGRTGSWRRWTYESVRDMWTQDLGIGGHVEEVRSLAWARSGQYLLSTGSDQTTRLYATWKRQDGDVVSWHEFARPQIHGYDLNCIDTVSEDRFISGADEKLLRVFDKPRAIDNLLAKLSGAVTSGSAHLPEAADIPVLGLSNKAVTSPEGDEQDGVAGGAAPDAAETETADTAPGKARLDLEQPPFEDHLARHTLWPEHEKLYGHGYEISAVATSNDGTLVATACKASSLDHAVIRLYETKEWREVKPPLTAHSLTVTGLSFAPDDRYLLSVGRDRQWAVFERSVGPTSSSTLLVNNPKGHSRMILDCCWAPAAAGHVFATAGRDKSAKIWRLQDGKAECISTYAAAAPLTAISFDSRVVEGQLVLAAGDETGNISLLRIASDTLAITGSDKMAAHIVPSQAISSLRWRPSAERDASPSGGSYLAAASDDCSVRIYRIDG
ncbi:hypothetical protein CERZMDRAFT_33254 [Cercospora zeae-maydis SCOH1-5]|uniref:Elongator complex protein 2 n=1 Tax=Cercospora zeae-maydis SCOH1-5 TaxID=717836 RepID=A0A6A6FT22_9PEZI|nr:hypothetical protein CERZMDRAFT_33254 [Cercospora zeae-maydis SCOH1-5]